MDLATPEDKVRKLQETLQAKAKGTPSYRFYLLYDKVYRGCRRTSPYFASFWVGKC